jgi:hypothetical protein
MLVGYPPFYADSQKEIRFKLRHWQQVRLCARAYAVCVIGVCVHVPAYNAACRRQSERRGDAVHRCVRDRVRARVVHVFDLCLCVRACVLCRLLCEPDTRIASIEAVKVGCCARLNVVLSHVLHSLGLMHLPHCAPGDAFLRDDELGPAATRCVVM